LMPQETAASRKPAGTEFAMVLELSWMGFAK
jgi:hypothetical protein